MNYVDSLFSNIFMRITYRYILVFVNRLTKMRHLVFITIIKIEKVANTFYINVWKLYETLEVFMSDRDTQFTSDVWNLLYKNLKIDVKLFTVYYL